MRTEQVPTLVLTNAAVLDVDGANVIPNQLIAIAGDRIVEVSSQRPIDAGVTVLDVGGRTVMPGLIDAHVHVTSVTANLAALAEMSPFYVAARSVALLRSMLMRGFTTVRDMGGADFGIAQAVEERHLAGPRILFGGKSLSQSGGHGDQRPPGRTAVETETWSPAQSRICDGRVELVRAVRDELRKGAHHIKLMVSGGITSPTDRIDSVQFSIEEMSAAVEEAESANRYVAGHAYTARAVNRALECGVRSIEHGNLMDESSVELLLEKHAFYVPTLATYSALAARGRESGLSEANHRKIFDVLDAGIKALEMAHRGGAQIVYGTDLLGDLQDAQLSEFTLRAQVQPNIEIIRAATSTAARLLRLEGLVGTIAAGGLADLLVYDGNPLDDISLLTRPDATLKVIIKSGEIVKNSLAA